MRFVGGARCSVPGRGAASVSRSEAGASRSAAAVARSAAAATRSGVPARRRGDRDARRRYLSCESWRGRSLLRRWNPRSSRPGFVLAAKGVPRARARFALRAIGSMFVAGPVGFRLDELRGGGGDFESRVALDGLGCHGTRCCRRSGRRGRRLDFGITPTALRGGAARVPADADQVRVDADQVRVDADQVGVDVAQVAELRGPAALRDAEVGSGVDLAAIRAGWGRSVGAATGPDRQMCAGRLGRGGPEAPNVWTRTRLAACPMRTAGGW